MISRNEAIEFCNEHNKMHLMKAEKLAKESDIDSDEIAKAKYNALVDLANKYADIAMMLAVGM